MTINPIVSRSVVNGHSWWAPGLALAAAGWGANQFAPLILMYRDRLELSHSALDAMYGLYALGLVPALLKGGRLSDRVGRRVVVLPALAVASVGTAVLMMGGTQPTLLYLGRLLTGLACGLAFGSGAAWLKELSAAAGDAAAAPRRTTVAITGGFALGPFAAGTIAQLAPAPTVWAYAPHLTVILVALAAVWRAPDRAHAPARARSSDRKAKVPVLAFVVFFVPFAPWVFGTAAVFLAYLTPLVAPQVGRNALLFSALAATIGATAGIAAQPLATAIHRPGTGRLVIGSMLLVVLGLGGATWAAHSQSPVLVLIDSVLLGVAYGVCQFCGLLNVQRIASPESLGTMIATYQVLSYVGFAFPYLMSVAHERWAISSTTLLASLTGLAALATLTLLPSLRKLALLETSGGT